MPLASDNCAKCGACTTVCPVYQATGRESFTARGKLHLLSRIDPVSASGSYADILSRCLLCGACRSICPQGIDTPALVIAGRGKLSRLTGLRSWQSFLARQLMARPALLQTTAAVAARGNRLLRRLPSDSGLRLRLGLLAEGLSAADRSSSFEALPQPGRMGAPAISYFTGCYAAHLESGILRATTELALRVTGAQPAVTGEQGCCGQAAFSCGDTGQARELAKRNIEAFAAQDLPILTACASCYHHLLRYPELLADAPAWSERARSFAGRLLEFSSFFSEATDLPARSGRIFYQDPCHLRFDLKTRDISRQILDRVGLKIIELPGGSRCCGMGGLFSLAHPGLSTRIRERLLADFLPLAPDLVTTTCSSCLLQWRQGLALIGSRIPVYHLAEVLTGYPPRYT